MRWHPVAVPAVILVGVVAVGGAFVLTRGTRQAAPRQEATVPHDLAATAKRQPTLYCDFYDFMRKSVVVSFEFDVDRHDPSHFAFSERYVIEPDNTRVDFGTQDKPSPLWAYALDDGTPTITAANNETRIVLYGLRPTAPGVLWIEAGVRSNQYRNLEGKCRQAYLAD